MKRCFVLACCILLSATWVSAESGALCLYSDAGGNDCSFVDNGGVVHVYIIHQMTDGASAVEFRLDVSNTAWSHVGDVWNFAIVIGNSINGVSIGYGGCQSSPFVVGTAGFMGSSAPANTAIQITNHPDADYVKIVDCDSNVLIGAGGTAYVNSALPCVCQANQVPTLQVDPVGLDFGYLDDTRELTIANIGGGTLNWGLTESLPWLFLSAATGTNTETVTASVVRAELPAGIHSGYIELTTNAGNRSIFVSVTVAPTEPILRVSPMAIDFGETGTSTSAYVINDGVGVLDWSIASDQPWLTVTPPAGLGDSQLLVTVDRADLPIGVYNGTLSVSSNGGTGTIDVSMSVPNTEPILSVSPLFFDFLPGDFQKILHVANVGAGTLEWTITTDQTWLHVNPSSGSNDADVVVYVFDDTLIPGTYYGNVSFTSNAGDVTIPVSWEIPPATLEVTPLILTFNGDVDVQYFDITNIGRGDLTWTVTPNNSRFSVDPVSGVNDQQVAVTVDRTGLPEGWDYSGSLAVTSNGGDETVSIRLYVPPPPTPVLYVIPSALSFGTDSYRSLFVNNAGDGVLEWEITSNAVWLSATPTAGTDFTEIDVHVDRTGLPDGAHTSSLLVTSNGGNITVPVDIWVGPQPVLDVDPVQLSFTPAITTGSFSISNTGTGTLEWTVSASKAWIEIVPPLTGANGATITVNVDPGNVPTPGLQTGSVTVSSNGGTETVYVSYVPPGSGVAGMIGVYSNADGTSTGFVDVSSGVIKVHLIHVNHAGANASRFRLDVSNLTWTWLGDIWSMTTTIGTSVTGVSIGYGSCLAPPTYLGVANFYSAGSTACRLIQIVPDPGALSGNIEVVDCGTSLLAGMGGTASVNCDVGIPVRHTTWGAIKAMYAPDDN
jgi:hypothetical protein